MKTNGKILCFLIFTFHPGRSRSVTELTDWTKCAELVSMIFQGVLEVVIGSPGIASGTCRAGAKGGTGCGGRESGASRVAGVGRERPCRLSPSLLCRLQWLQVLSRQGWGGR